MKLFTCVFLALVPIVCHAVPQPPVGATANDITKKSGASYDTNTPEVKDDLIKELFGGHGNPINENYSPPKATNIKVDSTYDDCSFYEEDGYKCVPYYLCDDLGEIITDGGPGLIDLRGNFGLDIELDPENSKCPKSDLEVCCRHPSYSGPLKPKVLPYTSKCGTRNINGIGVRIQNDDYKANTQFGEFPHMCAILEEKSINGEKKNLFVSGASLIGPGIVMTAAHSISNYTGSDSYPLKVRCGEWDTQQTIEPAEHQDRYVEKIITHPGYSNRNYSNNIALIFTKEDFVLSAHIDIICLPNLKELQDSYQKEGCIATGWGKDKFDSTGEYQVVLKKVELDIVDPYTCQNQLRQTAQLGEYFNLDPTFNCAGGKRAVDTCKGDGGGPLICPNGQNNGYGPQYVQAGIVAWGVGCGKLNVPGVYTDVSEMLCFIDWATRCEKGDIDYYGQDITGCRHWANRERRRLRENRKILLANAEVAQTDRDKRKLKRLARREKIAADKFDAAIKQCNLKLDDEIKDDKFDDYDNDLDLSGYLRIGESLSKKQQILSNRQEVVGERSGSKE